MADKCDVNEEIKVLLDSLMRKHKVGSVKELAPKLGIHLMTLYGWRSGKRKPGKESVQKLKDALAAPLWGDVEYMSQSFIAHNTTAYDAAAGMYCAVRMTNNAMASFTASMSVVAKVSDLLEHAIECMLKRRLSTIVRISSVYGDPENIVTADVMYIRNNGEYADYSSSFTVKTATVGGLLRYVYRVDNLDLGALKESSAGVVTDIGIEKIVNTMVRFAKNNERK